MSLTIEWILRNGETGLTNACALKTRCKTCGMGLAIRYYDIPTDLEYHVCIRRDDRDAPKSSLRERVTEGLDARGEEDGACFFHSLGHIGGADATDVPQPIVRWIQPL